MRIGVVFPQTEIGADVGAVRAYGEGVEELGFRMSSPTTTWSAPTRPCTRLGRPVRRPHHVPRAPGAVRLPRRHHVVGARDRDHHPAAAADGAGGQAGGGGRPAHGRTVPPRGRDRMERGGVRGARQGVLEPRPPRRGTDRAASPAVDRAELTFDGRDERVTGAGLAPLPVQRPIPLWIGVAVRAPPSDGPAASPTAGSRSYPRVRGWTRRAPSSMRRRARRVVTRGAGHGGPRELRRRGAAGGERRAPGAMPARPTCRSTRWTRASAPWTATWRPRVRGRGRHRPGRVTLRS